MSRIENGPVTSERSHPLTHQEWMTSAEVEYERLLQMFAGLTPPDWRRGTDCENWDVREVLAHLVGAARATASLRELARQARLGRSVRPLVDGMNAVQVRERADATPAELLVDLATAAEGSVRARRRLPAAVRVLRMPFGPPLGVRSVGYLMDRIYTRDAWMHRIDVTRATGRPLVLTPDHDGRLVDDIVREWAVAHGRPYDLTLTGPAGGHWVSEPAGQPLTVDAVEFCRVLSGREVGEGLLTQQVPF